MEDEKKEAFLASMDFMRLGQALSQKNRDMAMMLITRMQGGLQRPDLTVLLE